MNVANPGQPGWDDLQAEPEFMPMTAEQAQAWRSRHKMMTPWQVLGLQALVGVACALLTWLLTGKSAQALSVAYGALAVVLPGALLARVLSRKISAAGVAVLGFFVWEAAKLALMVAMLVAAPKVVVALSWPALLIGAVLTAKVYWVLLALRKD